ncbi:MAG: hypothetical protein WC455_26195 [Dehalococcoidia bacterium]|jgi:hypothetical protein
MSIIHLPLVTYQRPAPALGVETIAPAAQVERIKALHPAYVRWNGVRWPDQLGHEHLAALDAMPTRAIVVVQANGFVPDITGQREIAGLITGLAKQYPNIYAWELWNEPDAATFRSSVFLGGGWEGKATQYATFLTLVKRANPDIRILSGGLAEVGAWAFEMLSCEPECDGISFHHYTRYPWANTWALETKVHGLRALTDKPLYLTETSLLCADDTPPDDFDGAKAEYLWKVYEAARDLSLTSAIWYTVGGNGWEHSDLEGESLTLFKDLTD